MTEGFSVTKTLAQEKSLVSLYGRRQFSTQFLSMPKSKQKQSDARKREVVFKPAFIKSWRKYRGMTLEGLAAAADMSTGNLSNIETGIQGYTQGNLEVLAPALKCHPADLVAGAPGHAESILTIWAKANSDQRDMILKMAAIVVQPPEPTKIERPVALLRKKV